MPKTTQALKLGPKGARGWGVGKGSCHEAGGFMTAFSPAWHQLTGDKLNAPQAGMTKSVSTVSTVRQDVIDLLSDNS